jgi:hypothetical protein
MIDEMLAVLCRHDAVITIALGFPVHSISTLVGESLTASVAATRMGDAHCP